MQSEPVMLSDVAREAGVSLATASKALNDRDDVAPATRERVLAVAAAMSFSPNPMARALGAKKTGTVGIVTSDLDGRFMIPILMGAENAFVTGELDVFLCDARGDDVREQHHIKALLGRRVDGIIIVGSSSNRRASLGQKLPVPVVYALAPSDDPSDLSLTPDENLGGRIAIEHLLALGRTRIAHISGDPTFAATQDRLAGARAALADAGLTFVGEPLLSEWSEQWGRDAAATVFDRHPEVDAIFAGSDQIARGVLDTARDYDKRVPDDVSIVGYDNWEVLSAGSRPGLTTVDSDLEQLGRRAAQHIFEAIDGAETAGVHTLPVKLVIRGSTIARR
jgi:LacI family transcriptional regulator